MFGRKHFLWLNFHPKRTYDMAKNALTKKDIWRSEKRFGRKKDIWHGEKHFRRLISNKLCFVFVAFVSFCCGLFQLFFVALITWKSYHRWSMPDAQWASDARWSMHDACFLESRSSMPDACKSSDRRSSTFDACWSSEPRSNFWTSGYTKVFFNPLKNF